MKKEYKVLQSRSIDDIEFEINEYASRGWEVNGSITSTLINGHLYYTQTMVRGRTPFNEGNSDNSKQLLHG